MDVNKPQPSKLWPILKLIVLIVFIALFIKYFFDNTSDFAKLFTVPPLAVFAVLLLQFGAIVTNIFFFKKLLSFFDARIGILDSYKVIVKSSLINFFGFLQGGTGYRAYYAKKNFNVSYKKFTLLFAANTLVIFLVTAIAGLIGTIVFSIQTNTPNWVIIIGFIVLVAVLASLMTIKPSFFALKHKRAAVIKRVVEQWHNLNSSNALVMTLFGLALLQFTFMLTAYAVELWSIGYAPSFAGILVYTAIANLSILVAITPGAIGIRESLLIFSQNSLGVPTDAIILGATIDRILYFVFLVLLAISIQFLGLKMYKKRKLQ